MVFRVGVYMHSPSWCEQQCTRLGLAACEGDVRDSMQLWLCVWRWLCL